MANRGESKKTKTADGENKLNSGQKINKQIENENNNRPKILES